MKRNLGRALSLLLAILLLVLCLPLSAAADEGGEGGEGGGGDHGATEEEGGGEGDEDDLDFTVVDGVLMGYSGAGGDIAIPAGIIGVSENAFEGCTEVTSVYIPASVVNVGENAFSGCTSLTDFYVSNESTAFKAASGVLYTGDGTALVCCPCGKSGSLMIADGVTSIFESAFAGCTGLTSLSLPAGVTSIGEELFRECSGLTAFTVAAGNPAYKAVSGVLYTADGKTLLRCPGGKTGSLAVPAGVTAVDGGAFNECAGLTAVTLSDSVTVIGEAAFYGCTGLTSATFGSGLKTIGASAFYGCTGLTSVNIPQSVTSIGAGAFMNCSALSSVTIPRGLTDIGGDAFAGTPWQSSKGDFVVVNGVLTGYTGKSVRVTVPSGVTVIGPAAFDGRDDLLSVTLPSAVTAVGNGAFGFCTKLSSVRLGSVSVIGEDAFYGCTALTSATLPDGLTELGDHAFYDCSALTSVTVPGGVTALGRGVFRGCSGLTSATLSSGVTRIGEQAFYGCSALVKITIPASVEQIGDNAFYGCSKLTIRGVKGSYAESYAEANHIPFEENKKDDPTPGPGPNPTPGPGPDPDPDPDPVPEFTDVPESEYYAPAVAWAVENEIVYGLNATTFGPNNDCTRAQFVTFLWRAAGKPEPTGNKNPFVDVPEDYYTKAVLWAAEKEIVYGTTDTTFSPNDPVQRSQAVTFLYRYAGKPAVTGTNKFTDVQSGDYFRDAVLWGEKNGVVYGTDNTHFSPTNTCVRAQTVTFLYRYLGK